MGISIIITNTLHTWIAFTSTTSQSTTDSSRRLNHLSGFGVLGRADGSNDTVSNCLGRLSDSVYWVGPEVLESSNGSYDKAKAGKLTCTYA